MRTLLLFLFAVLVYLPHITNAQSSKEAEMIAYYKSVINYLTADELYGRPCCSAAEKLSADFIGEEMNKLTGKKSLRQKFSVHPPDSLYSCKAENVYCFINNRSKKTIVIGAHFDHLGYGGSLSKSIGKKDIHHGADDNASGVALMLGLMKAEIWKQTKQYNYLFVAYSAHEVGLIGSEKFNALCQKKFGLVALVINFDMVGRLDSITKKLVVHGGQDFEGLENLFPEKDSLLNSRLDDSIRLFMLDTKAFRQRKIPSLSFTTGINNDYHKVSDTADKLNLYGMWCIHQKLIALLQNIEKFKPKL